LNPALKLNSRSVSSRRRGENHCVPRGGRPRKERPEAVKRGLEKFARTYRPRVEKVEAELDGLRAERDRQIRQAYRDGLPMVEIAEILGVSRQTVSHVLSNGR
jgi:DNA-directed RNA polymerase specialized sigma24 family protein